MSTDAVIAVDIGGTQVRVALFRDDRSHQRAALPTDVSCGPSGVMDQIDALIEQVAAKRTARRSPASACPLPDR